MLLTRLRDYNPEDRNGRINNIKIVKGLIIKTTLNVHNLRFLVDSHDRCIVNLACVAGGIVWVRD